MSNNIVNVTDANFEAEVLQSDIPVVVDFWAEWCGPCQVIAPLLEQVADEYAGKVKIAKLDIETSNNIPTKYAVRGIPTLMAFKDGQPENTKVGTLSKEQLNAFLDSMV